MYVWLRQRRHSVAHSIYCVYLFFLNEFSILLNFHSLKRDSFCTYKFFFFHFVSMPTSIADFYLCFRSFFSAYFSFFCASMYTHGRVYMKKSKIYCIRPWVYVRDMMRQKKRIKQRKNVSFSAVFSTCQICYQLQILRKCFVNRGKSFKPLKI